MWVDELYMGTICMVGYDFLGVACEFLFSVFVVYGFIQGLGGAFSHITTDYYWKDVQSI